MTPHPTYLFMLKMCRVGLYTELFYAIIPTLLPCFLLICYPYILLATFLMFSSLVIYMYALIMGYLYAPINGLIHTHAIFREVYLTTMLCICTRVLSEVTISTREYAYSNYMY